MVQIVNKKETEVKDNSNNCKKIEPKKSLLEVQNKAYNITETKEPAAVVKAQKNNQLNSFIPPNTMKPKADDVAVVKNEPTKYIAKVKSRPNSFQPLNNRQPKPNVIEAVSLTNLKNRTRRSIN